MKPRLKPRRRGWLLQRAEVVRTGSAFSNPIISALRREIRIGERASRIGERAPTSLVIGERAPQQRTLA